MISIGGVKMEVDNLVESVMQKVDRIIEKPIVSKEELIPLMNELASVNVRLYLFAHETTDKVEVRKIKDLIKGLEGLIGTLKYQYRSYVELSRGDDA